MGALPSICLRKKMRGIRDRGSADTRGGNPEAPPGNAAGDSLRSRDGVDAGAEYVRGSAGAPGRPPDSTEMRAARHEPEAERPGAPSAGYATRAFGLPVPPLSSLLRARRDGADPLTPPRGGHGPRLPAAGGTRRRLPTTSSLTSVLVPDLPRLPPTPSKEGWAAVPLARRPRGRVKGGRILRRSQGSEFEPRRAGGPSGVSPGSCPSDPAPRMGSFRDSACGQHDQGRKEGAPTQLSPPGSSRPL